MKKIIFYSLIATNYFSIAVDCITKEKLFSLLMLIGLLVMGVYVTHFKVNKNSKFNTDYIFYPSVFLLYPSLLGVTYSDGGDNFNNIFDLLLSPSFKISYTFGVKIVFIFLSLIILGFLTFMVKRFNLSREILWIFLLLFSLNKSLFSLYMYVDDYMVDNILFHGICYILLVSTNKNFKFTKKSKSKKIKSLE